MPARLVRRTPAARSALLAVLFAAPGFAQVPEWERTGEASDARFGAALASGGDLDGDAIDDLVVGAPIGAVGSPISPQFPAAPAAPGRAYVLSGADGKTIYSLVGSAQVGDLFGFSVAIIGDTDLDGLPEFAVGAPRHASSFHALAGSVSVYGGASGGLRYRIFGAAQGDHFGAELVGHADANLDGSPDAIAGAPYADGPAGIDSGSVRLFVGGKGNTLQTIHGAAPGDLFGAALAPTFDITGDDIPDFVAGAPNAFDPASLLRPGRVSFYSTNGTALGAALGVQDGERFGAALAPIADLTGDGKGDVLIGAPGFDAGPNLAGAVSIVSTQNFQAAFGVTGALAGEGLGKRVLAMTGLDGAPAPDFAAATGDGRVRFFSSTGAALGQLSGAGMFGSALASAADVDGDGSKELAIGAPWFGTPSLDECGRTALHVGPGPEAKLKFSTDDPVTFSIAPGVAIPPVERSVVGVGFGAASFTITKPEDASWLLVAPASGDVDGLGDSAAVSFSVDTTKLSSASAATFVTLRDASTLVPFATLQVKTSPGAAGADPILCASAAAIDFVAPDGVAAPPPQSISLVNCGNGALLLEGTVSIEPPGVDWLAANANEFSIAPGSTGTITVSCDASGLAPGVHVATLRLTNSALGQVVDLSVSVLAGSPLFALGDKLKGTIADAADVDLAVFYGIVGLPIEIKGGPKDGSKPKLSLLRPDGAAIDTWIPVSAKSKKAFVLDRDGVWRLRVESGDGLPGDYQVKTKRDGLPGYANDVSQTITIEAPPGVEFEIGALPGCRLALAKIAPKTQPIGELTFALQTPSGGVFNLAAFDTLGSKSYTVSDVPLDLCGTWRFKVGGLFTGSKLKVVFDLEQPKIGKSTLTID